MNVYPVSVKLSEEEINHHLRVKALRGNMTKRNSTLLVKRMSGKLEIGLSAKTLSDRGRKASRNS